MEKVGCGVKQGAGRIGIGCGFMLAAAISCLVAGGDAGAFQIPTGNEDLVLRWDNTLRYTYGQRVKGQNSAIINQPNGDDGDRNFDVGGVTNRLDILSETDLVYRKDYGIRMSGALWYDHRYADSLDNTSAATSNHLVNGQPTVGFSKYADRWYAGPSGELLDAFAFGKFTIGDVPINLKVGRHTVYWGEAMFGNGGTHGISYGQSALDLTKALAQPSVELKELFRPRNQVSMLVQPTRELSIAANYYLQWESNRFPEPGTYLGFSDVVGNGSESIVAGPPFHSRVENGGDIEPHQAKDWGVATRWSPQGLGGTIGLYYRRFSDVNGQLHLTMGAVPVPGAPAGTVAVMPVRYDWAYASGIDLYGISFADQIAGVSIGSELSYRRNMPLWSDPAIVAGFMAPGVTATSLPGAGDTLGARGNTWHALVNFLYLFAGTPLYDKATGIAEFTWNRLDRVTSHPELFKWGGGFTDVDQAKKDFIGGQINFEPTWFQVMPGVDLSMPLSGYMGLVGNSCVTGGGTKNSGTYSVGFTADVFQKYKASLTYIGFFGPLETDAAGALQGGNGPFGVLKDRDMITLTLKASF